MHAEATRFRNRLKAPQAQGMNEVGNVIFEATRKYMDTIFKGCLKMIVQHPSIKGDQKRLANYYLLSLLLERRMMKTYPHVVQLASTRHFVDAAKKIISDERDHLKEIIAGVEETCSASWSRFRSRLCIRGNRVSGIPGELFGRSMKTALLFPGLDALFVSSKLQRWTEVPEVRHRFRRRIAFFRSSRAKPKILNAWSPLLPGLILRILTVRRSRWPGFRSVSLGQFRKRNPGMSSLAAVTAISPGPWSAPFSTQDAVEIIWTFAQLSKDSPPGRTAT